jgi:hypothetical protein
MTPSRTTEHRVNGATIHRIVFDDNVPLTDKDVIGHGKAAVFRIRRDRSLARTYLVPKSPISVSISTQVWHLLRSQPVGDLLGPDPTFWGCGLLVESWADLTGRRHCTGEDIVRMEFESESDPIEPEPADAPPRRVFVVYDNGTSDSLPLLATRGSDGKIILENHKTRTPIRVFDHFDGDPKDITATVALDKIPGYSVPTPEDAASRWLSLWSHQIGTLSFRVVDGRLHADVMCGDHDFISTSVALNDFEHGLTKEDMIDGSWSAKRTGRAKLKCVEDLYDYLVDWGYSGWPGREGWRDFQLPPKISAQASLPPRNFNSVYQPSPAAPEPDSAPGPSGSTGSDADRP